MYIWINYHHFRLPTQFFGQIFKRKIQLDLGILLFPHGKNCKSAQERRNEHTLSSKIRYTHTTCIQLMTFYLIFNFVGFSILFYFITYVHFNKLYFLVFYLCLFLKRLRQSQTLDNKNNSKKNEQISHCFLFRRI